MNFNGTTPLWDFTLPPALPEISDDQFFSLLNRQIEISNTADPYAKFTSGPTANPQALSNFPQSLNLSPLVSEESSPSPPGTSTEANGTRSRKVSEHQRATRSSDRSQTHDDALKRKASFDEDDDDDEEGQPQHKSFHGDEGNSKKSGSRRKSTSGANHKDESRLLKRKEQNRAAQRAFRERKEKHVKDLEDKVAMLEAKSDMQAAENENLRDLLSRLQSENLALKDSSFTFAFPAGSGNPPNGRAEVRAPSISTQSPPSLAHSPQDLGLLGSPGSTPHLSQSPPLFDQSTAYFSPAFFNLDSLPSSPPTNPYSNIPSFAMPTRSPYITVASNPLTMTFMDPPFSSYLDNNLSGSTSLLAATPPGPDITMNTGSMNDLFGGQFEGLIPFTGNLDIFSPSSSDTLSRPKSSSSSMSPVVHAKSPATQSPPITQQHQPMDFQETGKSSQCPKSSAELASRIAASQPGTFGPPVPTQTIMSFGQASTTGSRSDTPGSDSPFSFTSNSHRSEQTTGSSGCPLDRELPMTEVSASNVSLNDAWEQVSKHPQFQECDMDTLCKMLQDKAKCDGVKPVLERETVSAVMQQIPHIASSARK